MNIPVPAPSVEVVVGSIIEIDRRHLAASAKLPEPARCFEARITVIKTDPRMPGWLWLTARSDERDITIIFAVPPKDHDASWVGPKVTVLR